MSQKRFLDPRSAARLLFLKYNFSVNPLLYIVVYCLELQLQIESHPIDFASTPPIMLRPPGLLIMVIPGMMTFWMGQFPGDLTHLIYRLLQVTIIKTCRLKSAELLHVSMNRIQTRDGIDTVKLHLPFLTVILYQKNNEQ